MLIDGRKKRQYHYKPKAALLVNAMTSSHCATSRHIIVKCYCRVRSWVYSR